MVLLLAHLQKCRDVFIPGCNSALVPLYTGIALKAAVLAERLAGQEPASLPVRNILKSPDSHR